MLSVGDPLSFLLTTGQDYDEVSCWDGCEAADPTKEDISQLIKAIIFDMDGVIIDSEPIQSQAFKAVLTEYGAGPLTEPIVHVPGMRARENLEILKKRYAIDEDIEVLIKKREVAYLHLLKDNIRPRQGFLPLFHLLKTHGYRIALGTSSTTSVEIVLGGLGLEEGFDVIVTGFDVTHTKPHPEIFLKAAERLGVNPGECLVIEDSNPGVEAALRAGMKCIAIPTSSTRHQDLTGANLCVQSFEEIDLSTIQELGR